MASLSSYSLSSSSWVSSNLSPRRKARNEPAWLTPYSRERITVSFRVKMFEVERKSMRVPSLEPYLNHVRICNSGREKKASLIPFLFQGQVIGYINPKFLEHLWNFQNILNVVWEMEDFRKKVERKSLHVSIDSSLRTREEITSSMDYVTKTLHSKGFLPRPCGELFKVSTQFDGDTIFSADRNYVPYFGIQGYGVCVNGYVEYGGEKKMWVGKRSLTKRTYPGLLDQLAAGGLPEGLTCRENVIKECWEEAGIIETISERALLASILSFERIEGFKFERYVLFCYDLLLPSSLTPQCKDGEMECFKLMSIPEVKASLENSTKFNPNSAIVATDFLIRHGIIQPEQPGYLSLVKSMREGRCL